MMKIRATTVGFIFVAILCVVGVGACSSQPVINTGLMEGAWQMTTADEEIVNVNVAGLSSGEYYLDAGVNPISGVYRVDESNAFMVRPNNPRMKHFVWRRDSDRWLTLIQEPSVELSGRRFLSSTMVKSR